MAMVNLNGGLLDNVEDAIGMLDDLEFSAVPFAAARTLTQLAADGQAEVRRQLPDRFTIRRDRVARGVRIASATKKTMESAVYTLDWYMQDQQDGGTRAAKTGRARLIPSLNVRDGENMRGAIKRGMRPRAVLRKAGLEKGLEQSVGAGVGAGRVVTGAGKKKRRAGKPKAFALRMKSGKTGVFLRPHRGASNFELLYTLQDKVRVEARWEMDATVAKIANSGFRARFLMNLQSALENDRKAPGRRSFIDALLRGG